MAKSAFYVRPSEDISIGHALYPENSSDAFVLINETVGDGESTYIMAKTGGKADVTSSFRLSLDPDAKFSRVTSAVIDVYMIFDDYGTHTLTVFDEDGNILYTLYASYNAFTTIITVYINDTEVGEYGRGSGVCKSRFDASFLVDYINNHIAEKGVSVPLNLTLSVKSVANNTSEAKTGAVADLSQAVFILTCDVGHSVFKKINSTWKQAMKAFKKEDEMWTEISEDECKSILKNKTIRSG